VKKSTQVIYWLAHVLLLLVGYTLFRSFPENEFVKNVGASILAAGLSGMVIFVYILFTSNTSARLDALATAGLDAVFSERSVSIKEMYQKRLSGTFQHLDVIGFGLSLFREDYSQQFESWSKRTQVRILLLDPEFPESGPKLARIRDAEEKSDEDIAKDVKAFVRACSHLRKSKTFQIRLYRAIPTINYFRVDDEAFWGPYLFGSPSRLTPTLLVRRGGFLYAKLSRHFDQIWASPDTRSPPGDWYTS
jgi:hypothetical protein